MDFPASARALDAERRRRHSHAERGNEGKTYACTQLIAISTVLVLAQKPVDLGQKLGEIELAVASFTGGVEIGVVPVPFLFRERGVLLAGLAAFAMVLVIREEAGQVAQTGVRAGGFAAPAVTGGTAFGPAATTASCRARSASLSRLKRRAASVFWLIWSVFVMVTQVAEIAGPTRWR